MASLFPWLKNPTLPSVISDQHLNNEFDVFYRNTIRKLLFLRGSPRYLAKGNYNVGRIEYITHLFPDAKFIIMVRNLNEQVNSLMKQHLLFSEYANKNQKFLVTWNLRVTLSLGLRGGLAL